VTTPSKNAVVHCAERGQADNKGGELDGEGLTGGFGAEAALMVSTSQVPITEERKSL
jgi:hypothetical protein